MDKKELSSSGFGWGKYLAEQGSEAAPVHLFPHAQMASHWSEIGNGVKVEVLNVDCPLTNKVYWISQVIKVAGYKALLRYEGFGDDSKCDFWCNLCTDDVHPVGWCATIGKPLVPPKTIQFKYNNWKSFLVQRLTGSKTLPNDFHERVIKSKECTFQPKMRLEVMDKTQISRKRVGIVEEVVGGRLRLRYEDSDEPNDDFWCHAASPLIHHIGWSEKVGHRILVATKDYKNIPGFKNSKIDLFAPVKPVKICGFKVDMKLEAIDPLNLSCICVATVKKVLKNGYLMIGIDGSEAKEGSDWFCYHCTSPSIFPAGFCEKNDIILSSPKECKQPFSWKDYLAATKSEAAASSLFLSEDIEHGFTAGMKLEAVDLMEPRLLCVATIARVVGRLLRIHFDGWEDEYDQWVDSQSPDIYPVGWCELVGYELQPPVTVKSSSGDSEKNKKRSKPRAQNFSGKKKRKRTSMQGKRGNNPSSPVPEEGIEVISIEKESEKMEIESKNGIPDQGLPENSNEKTENEALMKSTSVDLEDPIPTKLAKITDAESTNPSDSVQDDTDISLNQTPADDVIIDS